MEESNLIFGGRLVMKASYKLGVFLLATLFAVATYQKSDGTERKSNVGARAPAAKAQMGVMTKQSYATKQPSANVAKAGVAAKVIRQVAVKMGGIPAPKAGGQYTLGQLFDLINTNNPDKNNPDKCSLFLTFFDNPARSVSGKDVGFDKAWIDKNRNLQVVLSSDQDLIQKMISAGAFPVSDNMNAYRAVGWADVFSFLMDKFPKLLLYFTLASPKDGQIYKLYIIDPWPQGSNIVLNSNLKPEQACRAYRLLMDWRVD